MREQRGAIVWSHGGAECARECVALAEGALPTCTVIAQISAATGQAPGRVMLHASVRRADEPGQATLRVGCATGDAGALRWGADG